MLGEKAVGVELGVLGELIESVLEAGWEIGEVRLRAKTMLMRISRVRAPAPFVAGAVMRRLFIKSRIKRLSL